jgi:hypothetical protein
VCFEDEGENFTKIGPEHGLMSIRFMGSDHVSSSCSATQDGVIMMLYATTAQRQIME